MNAWALARPPPATRLRLGSRELAAWRATLSRDYDPALEELLDDAERARLQALRRAADRERFALGAGLLRVLAGAYTGRPPERVRVDRTCRRCGAPHGKPALPDRLEASVSHSGDTVLVAVARGAPVGIDAEVVDVRLRVDELAPLCLTPEEEAALRGFDGLDRVRAFLALWTRKEAVVKATGHGLARAPRDVPVLRDRVPGRWPVSVHDLDLGTRLSGAVAVLGGGRRVRCLDAGDLLVSACRKRLAGRRPSATTMRSAAAGHA